MNFGGLDSRMHYRTIVTDELPIEQILRRQRKDYYTTGINKRIRSNIQKLIIIGIINVYVSKS